MNGKKVALYVVLILVGAAAAGPIRQIPAVGKFLPTF